jgi:hypothetical protein
VSEGRHLEYWVLRRPTGGVRLRRGRAGSMVLQNIGGGSMHGGLKTETTSGGSYIDV